jgi:hypothetical protein
MADESSATARKAVPIPPALAPWMGPPATHGRGHSRVAVKAKSSARSLFEQADLTKHLPFENCRIFYWESKT